MNAVLWILQVLLAAAFAAHGLMMLVPPPEVAVQMNAVLPRWFSLFIGVAEVLAAIGITLPGVTRIQPQMVAWSAWGLVVVMISATLWHIVRAEYSSAAITLVLLAMAGYVAYMRSRVMPIPAMRPTA
jgi:hypothetical protein